jgi:aryl-alcohol dehydrogenase-like predicted oxidoreductase
VLHQGGHIIPIPGTTRIDHLTDNLGADAVRLSDATLTKLSALVNQHSVSGSRYNAQSNIDADTEVF